MPRSGITSAPRCSGRGEKNKARTELQAALTKKPQQADEKKIRELLAGIS